jgi:transposase
VHFIPTSSSWLNLIERWFREITDKRLRRGTFHNVEQLIEAILAFIKEHNDNPQSYVWTAKADEILAKIERARKVLHKTPTA